MACARDEEELRVYSNSYLRSFSTGASSSPGELKLKFSLPPPLRHISLSKKGGGEGEGEVLAKEWSHLH